MIYKAAIAVPGLLLALLVQSALAQVPPPNPTPTPAREKRQKRWKPRSYFHTT